jgi:alkylation response protein AidB-like acyl-CoA dehydrogenase
MNFALTEEQELLQDTVRGFVAKECPPPTVRAIFDGERQAAAALWKGLAEIGVAGLVVPEAYGGAGLELLDLALVAEELGRGAVPVPFLGHALATSAIANGASASQREKHLPPLAAGAARATVALAEDGGRSRATGASSSQTAASPAASSSSPTPTPPTASSSELSAGTDPLTSCRLAPARSRSSRRGRTSA